ncbi:uncharacterized protein TM35_000192350 [Trypanosoma theileri]|uniref:MORN repeat-containing protein 5 n=1 Tax=Trypanosoma theileri TaxID=67003 RepID=A0A1X0NTQ4_9TRYP|nr:uncharacterized protein TM35_000192350 [Trypanosoma theileri]ORC87991.1 hypothetical protein TM35_000192350 [Trypanosoma theileri]
MGETTPDGKRFDNEGIYTFANGDTYVGAFKDGRMHGHGTLFFTAARGGGQYRGIWENGRNVSGSFVFADGLVYNRNENPPPTTTTTTDNTTTADTPTKAATSAVVSVLTPTPPPAKSTPARSVSIHSPVQNKNNNSNINDSSKKKKDSIATGAKSVDAETPFVDNNTAWLYCRGGDRRLWAEHLREVMPVLPLQALLAGERGVWGKTEKEKEEEEKEKNEKSEKEEKNETMKGGPARWAAQLVVAPSVAAEARTPATFAEGQPRTLRDIPHEYWRDPNTRARVVAAAQLPTPPFRGEETPTTTTNTTNTDTAESTEGTGVERTGAAVVGYGERPVMNLTLRIIKPLKAEAVVAAMAAMHIAESKNTPNTTEQQERKEEAKPKEEVEVEEEDRQQIPSVKNGEEVVTERVGSEQEAGFSSSALNMMSFEVGSFEGSTIVEHSVYTRSGPVHELTPPPTPAPPSVLENVMEKASTVGGDDPIDSPLGDEAQSPKGEDNV